MFYQESLTYVLLKNGNINYNLQTFTTTHKTDKPHMTKTRYRLTLNQFIISSFKAMSYPHRLRNPDCSKSCLVDIS